jgi:hypothetical protein
MTLSVLVRPSVVIPIRRLLPFRRPSTSSWGGAALLASYCKLDWCVLRCFEEIAWCCSLCLGSITFGFTPVQYASTDRVRDEALRGWFIVCMHIVFVLGSLVCRRLVQEAVPNSSQLMLVLKFVILNRIGCLEFWLVTEFRS